MASQDQLNEVCELNCKKSSLEFAQSREGELLTFFQVAPQWQNVPELACISQLTEDFLVQMNKAWLDKVNYELGKVNNDIAAITIEIPVPDDGEPLP